MGMALKALQDTNQSTEDKISNLTMDMGAFIGFARARFENLGQHTKTHVARLNSMHAKDLLIWERILVCMLVKQLNSKNARHLVTLLVRTLGWGPVWWMGARPHNGLNRCPLDKVTAGFTMGQFMIADSNVTTTISLAKMTTDNADADPGTDHGRTGVDNKNHLVVVVVEMTLTATTLALTTTMTT